LTWLPYYHDLGLVGQLLHALYFGATCYTITPVNFVQNPLLWIESLSKYKATITYAPNFSYEWCVRKIKDADIKDFSLDSLKVALNGAEPVHLQTCQQFIEKFGKIGFKASALFPAYGLAEATLVVSAKQQDALP